MKDKELTKAYIKKNTETSKLKLDISLLEIEDLKNHPYLLIIQSTSSKFSKITIYPLKRNKIIKVYLSGTNISEKILEALSKVLQSFEIIHSSGLLVKDKQLQYECYLNLNFSDIESKELKNSLGIIKDLNEVKIEEISLILNE